MAKKPSNKNCAKQTKKSTRKTKQGKRWSSILKWPSWLVWSGGLLILTIYAFVFYHFFVGPYSSRWKGIFGEQNCPKGYSIHGIDVSHHQGDIDWSKLRHATINQYPIRFVFVKATEGTDYLDENFNENFFQAKENNFIRGAYHYFLPSKPALEQARYFLKQVHLEEGDLPPVLDFEEHGNLTALQIKNEALTWLKTVEKKTKTKPIIYTNYDFKKNFLNDSSFNEYPYWIAHYYVDTLQYKGKWRFWQHTDHGTLYGINGAVDLNIYNGSMYDLQKFTIGKFKDW